MEEITFKRLLRWTLANLIVLVLIANVFGVGIASAETGTITVSQEYNSVYGIPKQTGGQNLDWGRIGFDNTSYNSISHMRVQSNGTNSLLFVYDFESTTFICNTPNTCTGYFYYDKNASRVYYSFDNAIISSNPIILTFANPSVATNITGEETLNNNCLTKPSSAGYPADICALGNDGAVGSLDYTTIATGSTTDVYNVTYSGSLFFVNITKGGFIANKYIIHNGITNYTQESAFTKTFNSPYVGTYNNGIYLNSTLSTGVFNNQLVNSTGVSGYVTPTPTPIINPITHGGILWDKTNYSLNEIGTVSYMFDVELFEDWFSHWIDIEKNGVFVQKYDGLGISGNIQYQFSSTGTYTAKYYKCVLLGCLLSLPSLLGSASVQVSKGQLSQIYPNATYYLGVKSNLSYYLSPFFTDDFFFSYWSADAGKYIPAYGKFSTPTGYGNVSFTCGVATTYKITLDGAVAFTKCISDNTKAGFNITTSFLNISSSTPKLLDYLDIEYGVDSVSWIGNGTVIKNYDKHGINVFTYPVGIQYDTIPFFLVYTPHEFNDMVVSTGINTIKLETESGIVLATKTINVSEINDNGYGLILDKNTFCSNEKITYKYYAVNDVNISLWKDERFISKGFLNASVTGKNAYFIHETPGVYDVKLMWGGTQFANGIITINSCELPAESTWEASGGTSATCGFWDGWVSNLAGGQGVNDLTRFMFALLVIGMITAFTTIITKNLGAGIITGFFPYAFFVFISLSTPCGQYMPVWTAVFIALIVGVKMRWF